MTEQKPAIDVAVLMRKERVVGPMSRWQTWRWVLDDVVMAEPNFGQKPRLLYQEDGMQRWLHPGFTVKLFSDDSEGLYLNASTESPCWFVMWRMDETPSAQDEPLAIPQIVTLSYYDAGRWLDAQENVENVPAPSFVVEWLRAFVDEHYVVEKKRRKRPVSFQSLQDRFGNPASVSTGKKYGRGGEGGA